MTKPPFTYFGGKTSTAGRIAAMLPAHEHYVEPFAGSLAVLLAKPPSAMETVNDLDHEIMLFWRMLRERPADLERVCALTPHSRAELAVANRRGDLDDLEHARRVWVRLTQGRGGHLQRGTGWRYYQDPRGSSASMPEYLDGYVGRMAAAARRLRHVSLECRPALDVIALYGGHPKCLLYCDPPYLAQVRSGTHGRAYTHELLTPDEHRDLAKALHDCRAAVVISGYADPLYDRDLYASWHRAEIGTWSGNASGDKTRTEVMWSNRPFPAAPATLFDDEAP
jgi:DNA adenine methylase